MFLRNFDNYITRCFTGRMAADASLAEGHLGLKDCLGQMITGNLRDDSVRFPFQIVYNGANDYISSSTTNDTYVHWSSDTSEPTYDDYTMTLPTTSSPVSASRTSSYDSETGLWTVTIKQIYVANADLTVGTVALYTTPYYYNPNKQVMIYKEKLAEPVFVPAESSFSVTINITFDGNFSANASVSA